MDRVLVVTVSSENAAYEAIRSLKKLDDEGSIELYSAMVIAKSPSGVKPIASEGDVGMPWRSMLGLSAGALIGLLGGPVGAAVGAAVGAGSGLGADLAYSGLAGDFVRDVSARLPEGGYAVVATVWEDWTAPVDVAMAPYGGVVLRQATDDVAMAQIRADMRTIEEEEAHLDAEIAKAHAENKAKLQAKKDELRARSQAQRERMRARADQLEREWQARMDSVREKSKAASAAAKRRHDEHAEKLSRFAAMQKQSFQELFSSSKSRAS